MNYIRLTILFTLLLVAELANSQTLADAVRYSTLYAGGTARTFGVGGSFGAMGADFGVLTINPAGIAEYRSSEFVISPTAFNTNATAGFNGGTTSERNNIRFGLDNIGVVFHHRPMGSNWRSFNLSIGLNTLANLDRQVYFEGTNEGSITERFKILADGLNPDELDNFEAGLAFDTGALFDFDGDFIYDRDIINSDQVSKSQLIESTGSIKELSLALAGNLNNKFSIGASLGIPFVRFDETKIYREDDPNDEIPFFEDLQFLESLNTSGAGINLKFGVIYKPIRQLRLGASFHSPNWYFLTDDFYTELTYAFNEDNNVNRFTSRSPDGNFQYRMSSPWKFVASAGSLFSAGDLKGFFNADFEYQDFRNNSFNLTSNSDNIADLEYEQFINNQIQNELTSVWNFRLGTEVAYRQLRLRAGYGILNSAYADNSTDFGINYSLGLGFRENSFFMDLGYNYMAVDENVLPYETGNSQRNLIAINEAANSKFLLTFGFKF